MNCVAIDPGLASGIAVWDGGVFRAGVAEGLDEAYASLEYWIPRSDLAVIEDFVISVNTAKKSQDGKTAIELIGVTRYLCRRNGVELEVQKVGDAKEFATNDKIRKLGWWTKGKDHSRDATRHLILAGVKHGFVDPSVFIDKVG